ncbi:glutamate receptor 3 [Elysia marginata]|uniref:Glutamate receptor 3 n=1 Tax=Elysia marginata TaxID=1093978 RepID=A0AAV4J5M0_9GAST|nr:glutamate receptor 3 [Elysia marginata]
MVEHNGQFSVQAGQPTTASSGGLNVLKVSTSDQAGKGGKDVYSGFVIDLLEEVARRAGFEVELFPNADGQVGASRGSGWTGVIGDVKDGRADIGAGAITVTSLREDAVDFSKPFMSNSINLLVQKPEWSSIGLGYLTRPFSTDYWIMVLVCLLLVGIVFFLIGKFSPYEWGNVAADRDPRGAKNSFTFRNSYLFALSTISWQGFREAPKSLSGRIMAAFWFLFVLFTLIAYTGNLTAYLLARPEQIPDMPFRTYEELLESSDIDVGSVNFGTTQEMLRKSHSETLRSLWSKMNSARSFVEDYEDGVQRAEGSNGGFVMFMESASAEYYARKHCDLMVFGENLFPTSMAFALPKTSVWK